MTGHTTGSETESVHACTIVRLLPQGGKVIASDSTLTLTNADNATIYIVNATSFNGFDKHPVKDGASYIDKCCQCCLAHTKLHIYEFKDRHIKEYQQIYNRVKLQLGNKEYTNNLPTDQLLRRYSSSTAPLPEAAQRYLETHLFSIWTLSPALLFTYSKYPC